jgi:hypothetical protein
MFFNHTTFIGVDPTAGQRPFSYAALDSNLNLLALGEGCMDDVLAFIAGQRQAFVAVSAPRQPNQGLLANREVRQELSPIPRPGRWLDFRLVEYQLRQHNIHIPQTSADVEKCPNWMREGFRLYQRLEGLNYRAYPQEEAEKQWLEVYPHACYAALLGVVPFSKHTLEGRLQRQLVLQECKLKVPDAMRVFEEITRHRLLHGILPLDNLYSADELDALIAAYTAWLASTNPGDVTVLGDPQEGSIIIPVSHLKESY